MEKNRLNKKELEKLHKNGFDVMHNLKCVQPGCNNPVEQIHPVGMPMCKVHCAKKYWNAVSDAYLSKGYKKTPGLVWYK